VESRPGHAWTFWNAVKKRGESILNAKKRPGTINLVGASGGKGTQASDSAGTVRGRALCDAVVRRRQEDEATVI